MENQSKLINKFYEGFWLLIIGVSILTVIIILLLIFRSKIINGDNIRSKGAYYFIMIVCVVFNGWLIYTFIPYVQDMSDVRSKEFNYITGEVIGYNKRKAIGDIAVSYKYAQPIVIDDDRNQTILEVNNTELNKTYSFIYLRHTKIAIIIEEH
jgi:hypothetical protein